MKFRCTAQDCDNQPFEVQLSELLEAQGQVNCEYCDKPCEAQNEAIDDLAKIISKAVRLIQAAEELPELPAYCRLWATDTELRIHMPYNRQMFERVQFALERVGYISKPENNWHSDEGNGYVNFYKGNIRLLVTLYANDKDATCRVEYDHDKVTPVYKVIGCQ
jgi:hypothetical protein